MSTPAVQSFVDSYNKGEYQIGSVKYTKQGPVEEKTGFLSWNTNEIKSQVPALAIIRQLVSAFNKAQGLNDDGSLIQPKVVESAPAPAPVEQSWGEWTVSLITSPFTMLWDLACLVATTAYKILDTITIGSLTWMFGTKDGDAEKTDNNSDASKKTGEGAEKTDNNSDASKKTGDTKTEGAEKPADKNTDDKKTEETK